MKSSFYCLLILSFLAMNSFGQQTVKLRKTSSVVYKGVETSIKQWYLYKEGGIYYLCNLSIDKDKVKEWFEKRKNSQNIYKGKIQAGAEDNITFKKENQVNDVLPFTIEKTITTVRLKSKLDNKIYTFTRL